MSIKLLIVTVFLMLLGAPPVQAMEPAAPKETAAKKEAPRFLFPVSCTMGDDCWIVNYNDSDAATGSAKDYHCGTQTYDGHDGTDFAVRDQATMMDGIDILAAADGKIVRARDEIEDREPSAADIAKMKEEKKGCGNGVLIDHGNGWQTIYCHMKQGSIVVKPGEKVATGQKIGQVGQSGMAEFPHVHFGVFHDSKTIDPFTGKENDGSCGAENQSLWLEGLSLDYEPFALYAAGFEPGVPDFGEIKKNAAGNPRLPTSMEALTFWTAIFGAMEGDKITMTITD